MFLNLFIFMCVFFSELSNLQQAIYCYSRLHRLLPYDCDILCKRAALYLQFEDDERAVKDLKKVLFLKPSDTHAIHEIATVCET